MKVITHRRWEKGKNCSMENEEKKKTFATPGISKGMMIKPRADDLSYLERPSNEKDG